MEFNENNSNSKISNSILTRNTRDRKKRNVLSCSGEMFAFQIFNFRNITSNTHWKIKCFANQLQFHHYPIYNSTY